jgi:hypothetical protein
MLSCNCAAPTASGTRAPLAEAGASRPWRLSPFRTSRSGILFGEWRILAARELLISDPCCWENDDGGAGDHLERFLARASVSL